MLTRFGATNRTTARMHFDRSFLSISMCFGGSVGLCLRCPMLHWRFATHAPSICCVFQGQAAGSENPCLRPDCQATGLSTNNFVDLLPSPQVRCCTTWLRSFAASQLCSFAASRAVDNQPQHQPATSTAIIVIGILVGDVIAVVIVVIVITVIIVVVDFPPHPVLA